jgi:hypothetical protein
MKYYIIHRDTPDGNDFTIMRVRDELIEQFEKDHQDKVLAIGQDVQEAIIEFGKKQNQFEPIKLGASQALDEGTEARGRSRR